MAIEMMFLSILLVSQPPWEHRYEADSLPTQYGVERIMSSGYTEEVSGGLLTITGPAKGLLYYKRGGPSGDRITVEARGEVNDPSAGGSQIGLSAPNYGYKNVMIKYDEIWDVPVTGGEFHTIFLALNNATGLLQMWIDGEFKKEATVGGPFSFAVFFGKEWVYWNPLNSTWNYVYYVRGYYQPGTEEVKEDITGNRLQVSPSPFTWQTKVLGHEDEVDIEKIGLRTWKEKELGLTDKGHWGVKDVEDWI
ncbi:MAG TPA: hypothetical protein ENI34_02385 [candidate division WOR-3 bacterium]|uniref:Uncharacterized protein n=1 Tax=candidate division WOR-3 bacterium TaxID=2052148 RepID=A0A9C9ELD0_UNCW3|nr:hypothetical protein [candidate division WOR-3 bacterium]